MPSLLTVICTLPSLILASTNATIPRVKATVDTQITYQTIDGFGVSQAFQRARQVQRLATAQQQKALDLLFSPTTGAGLTILRNGIGSSPSYDLDWMKSIAPNPPNSSASALQYSWDGDDAGQVWLTKEALKRAGSNLTVYADAWSTPGYMKTNGNDSNGGAICGTRETNCPTGDWRKAYADYLIQLLRFYKDRENITISHLGFLNEPDLNQTYASMQVSGFQAADMLAVLRPTLRASEFSAVKIVCCEATGWGDGQDLLAELQSVPGAAHTFDIYSAHGYSVHPTVPLATPHKVWQTEWADLNGRWNAAWDDRGKEGEGIAWANKIHEALTGANVSGFLYWIGVAGSPNNDALVRIDAGSVSASKRLWAMAQWGRFVRPGMRRVEAESEVGYVRVGAYRGREGIVVQVLNNGHTEVDVDVEIRGAAGLKGVATPWRTGNDADLEKGAEIAVKGGKLTARVGRREMVSFVF